LKQGDALELHPAESAEKGQELRYERKFLLPAASRHWVEAWLKVHPAAFREPYPARHVNSLYFDSPDGQAYRDAVDGAPARRKVRIRWYGDLFGDIDSARLEVKLKRGYLGRKLAWPVAPFRMDQGFDRNRLARALAASALPQAVRIGLCGLELAVMSRYRRKYLESARNRCRVTVDSELEFWRVREWVNPFVCRATKRETVIVEIKYPPERDRDARGLLDFLPLRLTKSSKFVQGLEELAL